MLVEGKNGKAPVPARQLVPLCIVAPCGPGLGVGADGGETAAALLAAVPGLHVLCASRPEEAGAWLRAADLVLEDVSGLVYDPLRHTARIGGRTDVNYLACAVKP